MKRKKAILFSLFCSVFFVAPAAAGEKAGSIDGEHEQHRQQMTRPAERDDQTVNIKLLDLELLNQDGKPVRFRSQAIGEKRVVMDFIFTSCTTICPVYSALFAKLQNLLGDRLGKEVVLVSVSVDPTTDIPPRLKEYAGRYQARPGWTFLTGEKSDVDRVLTGLDVYTADFTDHPPVVLVGDGHTGAWRRLYGFPTPEKLIAALEELENVAEGKGSPGSLGREP